MASRVVNRLGSGTLRPIGSRLTPALSYVPARSASNTTPATQPDPKTRAQAIIDALPGSSIVSKTAILSAGAGLSLAAISSELYVVNEESIVAFSLLSIFFAVGKYGGPMYADWAKGQIQKVKGILEASRARHSDSVQQRIDSFKELEGVVDLTKSLFALSKETAELEAKAFELEQRAAVVGEARSVLDSWVRYEGQVKARQQKELSDSVVAKIRKELENPRVLQQILQQSVADVERLVSSKAQ